MFSNLRKLIPMKLIYLSHIFLVAPTLLYIGVKVKCNHCEKKDITIYNI